MQSVKPSWAAINNGEALSSVNKFALAPSFNNSFKHECLPYCAAVNKGVAPSLFCVSMLAPAESSNWIKSSFPAYAASCSALQPPTSWLFTSRLYDRKIWKKNKSMSYSVKASVNHHYYQDYRKIKLRSFVKKKKRKEDKIQCPKLAKTWTLS